MPATVTVTGPVDVPGAMIAMICVSLQLLTVGGIPLNRTALLLWVAPKPLPVMATGSPLCPIEGDEAVIAGCPPRA